VGHPAQPVRVLVVDDSVVMRRVVARALERDPGIARTDYAANGRLALEKLQQRLPDVVVLDLEMPELDGFATLQELRRRHPALPVVLFSSLDERVAAATLDALSLGAVDFVLKPSGGSVDEAEAYVAAHLTPLVKGLAAPARDAVSPPPAASSPTAPPASRAVVQAVVVGVSTGGPDALSGLLAALPAGLPVPLLVVQHMPPVFTRLLAERLERGSALTVVEATDGEEVRAGHVYVAPGGRHLAVARGASGVHVALHDGPPENSCRPAADVLFRSAATAYGPALLALVMTGMGSDGTFGAGAVRAAGGQVVVQDPASCVIGSMPASVLAAGLATAAVPLDGLPGELVARVRVGR
jgi:two-component system chemotaxis response regulator CheB